jgi:hypothetical protein
MTPVISELIVSLDICARGRQSMRGSGQTMKSRIGSCWGDVLHPASYVLLDCCRHLAIA